MKLKIFTILVTLLLFSSKTWSAVLPGPALPEQVSKALVNEEPKAVEQAPSVQAPTQKPETPGGEAAKKIKFQLNNLIVEGNHVYSDAQLRPLYEKKLHKTITVAELFGIVQDITNYYRNNGYIISRAILPPQHVKNGVVKIQVIEGFIDKVEVGGNPKGAKCLIKAFGNRIRDCRPLRIANMEKYLLLANETPATTVKAVLAPSKKTTGAADLTLTTENQTYTGYVSYDNYGTRYIGPQQMTGNLGLNSIFTPGDSTQLTLTKTPKGGELTFTDINYSAALNSAFNTCCTPGSEGVRWLIGSTRAQTHPLFVLRPAQIDGLNNNYYTNIQFPIMRTRTDSLTYQIAFNWLDSHVTALDEPLYTDHIRSAMVAGTYNFADRWKGVNLVYLDLRQGLPIFGYTTDTSRTAETSRPGGRAGYTKIDMQASRLQALEKAFTLYGLIKGQWAFNPLLAAEQFTFGGPILGRGYDVAELIGDRGIAGTLELRRDWAPNKFDIQNLQFYLFYDFGRIWNIIHAIGAPGKASGTSTGAGVRFYMTKYLSGNLMWTQVLTKEVAAEELIGQGHEPRVFFSIVAAL